MKGRRDFHPCNHTISLSVFNPAPARSELPAELYTLPSIFCLNETEAQLLTGISVVDVPVTES